MAKNIDIGGRLHSVATGNVVAGANEILDDAEGKKQSVINAELRQAIIDSQINEAEATVDEGVGTPSATAVVIGQKLLLAFQNIMGDGIASIQQTTTSQESGGVNVVTVTTVGGTVGTFQIRNGAKGDTVILGEGVEYVLYNGTGQNTDGAMTQKAVTDAIAADDVPTAESEKLIKSGAVRTAIDERIDEQESKNYIFALADKDGKMIAGVDKDGKLVCGKNFLEYALIVFNYLSTNDVVDALDSENTIAPLSAKQGKTLKGLIDALSSSVSSISEAIVPDDVPTAGSQKLVKSGGVRSAIDERIDEQDSANYILSFVDQEGKMIFGIDKKAQLVCGKNFLESAMSVFNYMSKDDVVDNLDSNVADIPLSAKQGNVLKGLIDALNTELDGLTDIFVTNDTYLIAIVDANDNVLWGVKKNGKLDEPTRLEDSANWLFTLTDADDKVVFGIKKDGEVYAPGLSIKNYDEEITSLQSGVSALQGDVEDIQGDVEELQSEVSDLQDAIDNFEIPDDIVEVAVGKQKSYHTYQSELDASPFVDNSNDYFVGYNSVGKNHGKKSINKKLVVMNHDDGTLADAIATRKIYNKYGFSGSFCCIFTQFGSIQGAKSMIVNMRKLVKEGHSVGLHAIMTESYWYANRVYDVKPDGSSNFAPLLNEIKGSESDGTGTNTFGQQITASTLASEVYYMNTPASVITELNTKVVELTQAQVNRLNRQYCLYSDEWTASGIDDLAIEDIIRATSADTVTKSRIGWIEYYYNGLVDNTLGFSSTASSIAEKFAEDYSVPSGASVSDYYPDAAHLKNGKMVYWNDTTNAHYSGAKLKTASGFSESDYQLVGKFTKGLYKDCFSTMNFEVMDRCVEAAEAFFRKYYGIDRFAEFHIHGVQYLNFYYEDSEGGVYADREKDMIYYPLAKWYSSRRGAFVSVADIMYEHGMTMMKDGLRRSFVKWVGSQGFYYKAAGIRNNVEDFNNNYNGYTAFSITQYLTAFGTTSEGVEEMSYSDFMTFLEGVDDWTKFVYENGGSTMTRNGKTMRVYTYLKSCMDKVVGSIGTGAVPVISVDTLRKNPAIHLAVELFFRFLKNNGFEVASLDEGRRKILSVGRETGGNLFPNPSFERSILNYFGGSSTNKDAYRPDGWLGNSWGNVTYNVEKQTIENVGNVPVLTISGGTWIATSVWGLPAGKYKLSYWSKGSSAVSILTCLLKNKSNIDHMYDSTKEDNCIIDTYNPQSAESWAEHTVNIEIPDFHRNPADASDFFNVACDGYEDNICAISLRIGVGNNDYSMAFACPRLYMIND